MTEQEKAMTEQEKAVTIFELRERGMHPQWVKWFIHCGTRYDWNISLFANPAYRVAPSESNRRAMRKRGFNPDAD